MNTFLFSQTFLVLGVFIGWFLSGKYTEYLLSSAHEYDEIFEKNPHPELYDDKGKLDKGEYVSLNFDLGYDPETYNPDDLIED